jgi:hypothetical protein
VCEKHDIWDYTALSVIGTSHQKNGQPCQDACAVKELNETLICVAADGAGSARYADIGAKLLVKEIISDFASLPAMPENETEWLETVKEMVKRAREKILEKAQEMESEPRELAATLLVAIIAPDAVVGVQIGDGAIIYGREDEDNLHLLIKPDKNEYLNETSFISSENYARKMITNCEMNHKINRIALITDGLQMLALDMKINPPAPHPGFFNIFFDSLDKVEAEERKEQLENFLHSERICSRTDDDKTLIFAAKKPLLAKKYESSD